MCVGVWACVRACVCVCVCQRKTKIVCVFHYPLVQQSGEETRELQRTEQ